MSADRDYYQHVTDTIAKLRPSLPPVRLAGSGHHLAGQAKRMALRILLCVLVGMAVLYVGDDLVFRFRLAHGSGLGAVEVERLYAIRQKSGKTEFDDVGSETQTCVRSIFPHAGYAPCWYLSRHSEQQTNF